MRTGAAQMPTPDSAIGSRFLSSAFRVPVAEAGGQSAASLAARKREWKEGRSEDDSYMFATFRALSAGIVNELSFPIDFSKQGVLKKATPFLIGTPFMKDHRYSVDSQIGSVQDTIYDNQELDDVPPGINALVRVNLKAPQAATAIPLIESGDAKSVSVTVWYKWDKSHPEMEWADFWEELGNKVDGQVVRIVANEVQAMSELSLVWDGADPHAERIYFSAPGQFATLASGLEVPQRLAAGQNQRPASPPQTENQDMDTAALKKALAAALGVEESALTDELVKDVGIGAYDLNAAPTFKRLNADLSKKNGEYAATIESKTQENAKLATENAALKPQAELGAAHLASIRTAAAAHYKLCNGDKASAVILSMIEAAPLDQATALCTQFENEANAKVPLKCGACGSQNVSRAQSAATNPDAVQAQTATGENPRVITI